jgi:hypothetical protein
MSAALAVLSAAIVVRAAAARTLTLMTFMGNPLQIAQNYASLAEP